MAIQGRNNIGYALGGGGARGLSHIGALKVLEKQGILPDFVTGTSIGALTGALYASGLKATEIEQLALQLNWKRLALLTDFTLPVSGLVQGKRVIALLESLLGNVNFTLRLRLYDIESAIKALLKQHQARKQNLFARQSTLGQRGEQ